LERLEKIAEEVRIVKENQIQLLATPICEEDSEDLTLPMNSPEDFQTVQDWMKLANNRENLVIT